MIAATVILATAVFVMDLRASSEVGTPTTIESSPADRVTGLPVADGGVWAEDDASTEASTDASSSSRRTYEVRVVVQGKDHDVKTHEGTVRQLLTAMGIELDANDRVTPPPSTPLRKVNSVRVTDVSFHRTTATVKVDPPVTERVSEDLKPGESEMLRRGTPGRLSRTYAQKLHDGEPVGKQKVVSEVWVREPVPAVRLVGPEPVAETGGDGGGGTGGSTAWVDTGVATWYRVDGNNYTAAHPTLPFGTRLLVTNLYNGKSVTVMVNDRGPFAGASLDLSDNAFAAIAPLGAGHIEVRMEKVHGDSDIRNED